MEKKYAILTKQLHLKNILHHDKSKLMDSISLVSNDLEQVVASLSELIVRLGEIGLYEESECKSIYKKAFCSDIFSFQTKNPYAICAFYHLLKIRDDKLYWCFGPTLSLFATAANRLPWNSELISKE